MSWSPKNKSTRSSYSSSKLPLKKAVELKQECICHSCFQAVLEQKDVYDEKQNTDDKTVFICDHCEANISHFTQNKYHTCKDDTCKGILCPSCYRHYQNSYHELVQVSSVTFAGSEYKGITDIQFRYMNQSAEDVEPLPGGMGLSPIELEEEEYITEINGAFETIRKYTIELEFVTSLGRRHRRQPEGLEMVYDKDIGYNPERFLFKAGPERAITGIKRKNYQLRGVFKAPTRLLDDMPLQALKAELVAMRMRLSKADYSYMQGSIIGIDDDLEAILSKKLHLQLAQSEESKHQADHNPGRQTRNKLLKPRIQYSRFTELGFLLFNIAYITYNFYDMLDQGEPSDKLEVAMWMSRITEFVLVWGYILLAFYYYYVADLRSSAVDSLRYVVSTSSLRLVYTFGPTTVLTQITDSLTRQHTDLRKRKAAIIRKKRLSQSRRNRPKLTRRIGLRTMSKISPIVRQTEIQAIALDNQERYLIPLLSGLFALVVTALFVTVASAALVVKLSELSFVTADEWTFFNVMSLLAFANQLSGMASVSTISMNTIYQFVFAGDDLSFDSAEIKQMQMLDHKIKNTLIHKFGWYGMLIAFTLTPADLQRVMLKDTKPFFINFDEGDEEPKSNSWTYARPVSSVFEYIYSCLYFLFKGTSVDTPLDSVDDEICCWTVRQYCSDYFWVAATLLLSQASTLGLGAFGLYLIDELETANSDALDCFDSPALLVDSIGSLAAGVIMLVLLMIFSPMRLCVKGNCMRQETIDELDNFEHECFWLFVLVLFICYVTCGAVCGILLSLDVFDLDETCMELITDEDNLFVVLRWNIFNAFIMILVVIYSIWDCCNPRDDEDENDDYGAYN